MKLSETLRRMGIRKKLIVFCSLLMLVNGSIFFFYNRKTRLSFSVYEENQERYFVVNSIYTGLQSTKRDLSAYLSGRDAAMLDAYRQEQAQVRALLAALREGRHTDAEWHLIRALCNASESYFKQSDLAAGKVQRGESDYFYSYYAGERILGYIPDYINEYLNIRLRLDKQEGSGMLLRVSRLEAANRAILFLSLVIGVLFSVSFSSYLTRPLKRLADASEEMAGGNLDLPPLEVPDLSDLGKATRSFNIMSESIRELVREIDHKSKVEARLRLEELKNARMAELLRESQFLALQSQINPHFLFNTLNAISRAVSYGAPATATALVESLADLFRYNLDHFNNFSTIGEELEIVEKYIYIQKYRFRERIRLEIQSDPRYDRVVVPSMLLQPLVENAVIHGLESLEFGGGILIRTRERGGMVVLRVYDDGVGIPREKIREIYRRAGQAHTGHTTGIGLANIMGRIDLLPGSSFRINSGKNRGTLVEIRIPFQEGGREDVYADDRG